MNEEAVQRIGDRVRRMREEQGIGKGEFALMVGISRPYLNRIENGTANVTVKMLVRVAEGLDVDAIDLLK